MMSSKQVRSFMDPLVQSKMEVTVGTVVTAGLPKEDSLARYTHDKALPNSRTYFSYSVSGQDALDFPSPWGPSKTCVKNGSSPGIHSSAIYRPENMSFPVDGGHSAVQHELATKERLACYASSPRRHSPRAAGVISPVAVSKHHIGGSGISSTAAENCVGLAIPRPVYGHSPCCAERGCNAGHNYGVEHGPQRMSPHMYEDEWAAHFSHLAYLHKKGQDALAPQRVLHLAHGTEGVPLKDRKTEGYQIIRSEGPRRSLPLMEPSHSSYTYNTTYPYIGSTSEYCQHSSIYPQIYKGLPPAYETGKLMHCGVPSKVCQDHSHVSKCTPMPPCPIIDYHQNGTEAYRADPNVFTDKQTRHGHICQIHSPLPDSYNMSNSCSAVRPCHPLITNFPTYHPYGVHLNSNSAFLHERPCPPFSTHQSERPLDFSKRRVQTPDSPRELCLQSGTSGAFQPTPAHYRRLNNTAAERPSREHLEIAGNGLLVDGGIEFGNILMSHGHCVADPPNSVSPSKRHREECENISESDIPRKKNNTDTTHEQPDEPQSPSSPPMPVINKVFSLAPYKIYFEASGMLPPPGGSKSPKPQPEAARLEQEPEIKNSDVEYNSGENVLSLKLEAQTSPANSNSPIETPETVKIKTEKLDPDESEMKVSITEEVNHQDHISVVKEEQGELNSSISGSVPCNVVIKSDFEEESNPPLVEKSECPATYKSNQAVKDNVESVPVPLLPSRPPVPPLLTKFSLSKIPPHCLKLSNYKIVIPEVLKAPETQSVEVPQFPVEAKPIISSSKHARHQFMELHQSLCRLLYNCVTQTSCQELKDWLSKQDLRESVSNPSKTRRVSCLLGSRMRAIWLKGEDMVMALRKVVGQLQKYIESCECPFPHVMRAGAVFIPMLVVKEVLFPQVQGTLIDQVLLEHRVELRPTTLSEERQLTQLHRKAFSSKLRRLLSLKHLPDIYPDVLNLLYHANVCKFLGAETSLTYKRESTDSSDESSSCVNCSEGSSRPLTPETTTSVKKLNTYCLKKKKGRVKISSKRTFLADSSSSQEEDFTEEPERWSIVNSCDTQEWEVPPVACNEREVHVEVKIEDETQQELENSSWGRPLTSDDLSSESSDEEMASTPSLSYRNQTSSSTESQGVPKGPSSMVIKLRKVFYNEGHRGRVTRYQKVTDSLDDQGKLRGHDRFRSVGHGLYRKKKHKSSRHKRHHTYREVTSCIYSSYSQNRPYLSKKHSSKRRWVLRCAVQSAHLAMENRYPDLVGKRIRHLYEENDKTEVWYIGVVVRIHEPHTNPLKTVFEVKYDSEPEWQYYLELLLDYKKGWLKVED
ncbi:uncharacterized protein LOC127416705 [Myxocyprinus asiaticus]|uniref:uncharacterized protein LOC127416705 n=1 Tax=Myxocyprinus asiaticus TaxID=70543 RepID=UPI0022232466|nr:uncharacterized protein LOC127416705 [Myxocyprinus asiaticus]